jgi:hypothetical protein
MVGRVKGRLLRRRWGDAGRAGPEAAARSEAMVGEARVADAERQLVREVRDRGVRLAR